MHPGEWLHLVLTWRKDEARCYLNGSVPCSTTVGTGVLPAALTSFIVAREGMTWLDFQKKEFEDDCIMDELQVFRRPFAAEEVRSLFERGHIATRLQRGNVPDGMVCQPEREYAGHAFVAPCVAAPLVVDGIPENWKEVLPQSGLIERRIGVLDDDPTRIYTACDDQNLYLGFQCEVDLALQKDPTHIKYPLGQFLTTPRARDGDVYADDYTEFVLRTKDPHVYRFAVNSQGNLLDSRDGDKSWNGNVPCKGRSDFKDWTAELAIPLADLGVKLGDVVDFNVIRSWKLFKSAQNSLCADERGLPGFGKLTLGGFDKLTTSGFDKLTAGGTASASLEGLGNPGGGDLAVTGRIRGPPGEYTVRIRGKGYGAAAFSDEQKVTVKDGVASFTIKRRLDKPSDLALVVTVLDPAGKEILVRTLPFAYVATSAVELANYPGWGQLDVTVTPIGADRSDLRATVALVQGATAALKSEIAKFDDPAKTVRFDTRSLAVGKYEVVTTLARGGPVIGEDRQPYEKKPPPEWYASQAGVIDVPPRPWTEVRVTGDGWWRRLLGKTPKLTVECLLKRIGFQGTLFPNEIISNGSRLLNGPLRIRVKQNGQERVLTAGNVKFTNKTPRRASWEAVGGDPGLQAKVNGWIEFDGFTWMDLRLAGGKVEHLSVEIPLRKGAVTLKNLDGIGPVAKPLKANYAGYWFGNEKAGLQYWWEDQRGWVVSGEPVASVTPSDREVVISIPFIQKAVDLKEPRTVTFGLTITPSKPIRKDWRYLKLYRKGVTYTSFDYSFARPNYPSPLCKKEDYELFDKQSNGPDGPITCWYGFGTCEWVGSPEYAEWWREWRWTPSDLVRPDPNSTAWAPACPQSSSANLYMWMMDRFVKNYPQRGVYYDCKQYIGCDNEAHGCGWVDANGARQGTSKLLAQRRFFERVSNIIKSADPAYGWIRHHDWGPNMVDGAFMDENWIGEGLIGPIQATPEKNYYRVVDLPMARYCFLKEPWGHPTGWLTELACSAGTDKAKRAEWYGKMVRPPKDGRHGDWTLPRWKDYEHVAGLALTHDMWNAGGNDLTLPVVVLDEVQRRMGWDDHVKFIGYWDLGDALQVEGGIPEKIVCSVFYRPAGPPSNPRIATLNLDALCPFGKMSVGDATKSFLRAAGARKDGWLVLAPFNNTDEDATVTLRPNLKKFGFASLANGRLHDIYRAFDGAWQGPPGWLANAGDPEAPYLEVKPSWEVFPIENGAARIPVAKRNFRALVLLGRDEAAGVPPPTR